MKVLCILLCVAFASGFYIDNNEIHEEKIVGGDNVRIEEVPYQATLLWFRLDNYCGATIIHEFWVITAAHCVKNKLRISVRTGSGSRKTRGKVHRVEKIIMHPDFHTDTKKNDITLIQLAEPIQFNDQQQPIEPAKSTDIPRRGESMRISGFGKIGDRLPKSEVLRAAHVLIMNHENCERAYRPYYSITDNMFCAGNGNADACLGDSGGPGVIDGKLYGIISFGRQCASRVFPGVYTSVHKYYDWIVEKSRLRF